MKPSFVLVTTTTDRRAAAERLAGQIVRSRLAACAQIVPIRSVYWWKGKVRWAGEHLLLAKTRAALARALVRFIKAHHAYEVPEVTVAPIVGGWADYLAWIRAETRPARTARRR